MAKTATYCSECYNKVGRVEDAVVKAAEASRENAHDRARHCCKCSKATIVVYYRGKQAARPACAHCVLGMAAIFRLIEFIDEFF